MTGVIYNRLSEVRHDPGEPRGRVWAFLVNSVAASHLLPSRLRSLVYRSAGIDVSMRAMVRPGVIFRCGRAHLGAGTTVNYRCVFDNRATVVIGERVGIGIAVQFITSTHDFGDERARAGAGQLLPISVGDGSWIGSGAIILPGVTIGVGVVVAAGSVVTRDCLSHGLYGGVPAKRIRELPVGVGPG